MASYIERQAISRELQYKTKPLASQDEAMQRNFEMGIVAGLRLAINLPKNMEELEREQFNAKLAEARQNGND